MACARERPARRPASARLAPCRLRARRSNPRRAARRSPADRARPAALLRRRADGVSADTFRNSPTPSATISGSRSGRGPLWKAIEGFRELVVRSEGDLEAADPGRARRRRPRRSRGAVNASMSPTLASIRATREARSSSTKYSSRGGSRARRAGPAPQRRTPPDPPCRHRAAYPAGRARYTRAGRGPRRPAGAGSTGDGARPRALPREEAHLDGHVAEEIFVSLCGAHLRGVALGHVAVLDGQLADGRVRVLHPLEGFRTWLASTSRSIRNCRNLTPIRPPSSRVSTAARTFSTNDSITSGSRAFRAPGRLRVELLGLMRIAADGRHHRDLDRRMHRLDGAKRGQAVEAGITMSSRRGRASPPSPYGSRRRHLAPSRRSQVLDTSSPRELGQNGAAVVHQQDVDLSRHALLPSRSRHADGPGRQGRCNTDRRICLRRAADSD